jgi:CBS domain-containing protein
MKLVLILTLLFHYVFSSELDDGKSKVLPLKVKTITDSISSGSGVVIGKNKILTAYHVIDDAKDINLTIEDKSYPLKVLNVSTKHDLAILTTDNLNIEPIKKTSSIKQSQDVYSISGDGLVLKGYIAKVKPKEIIISYKVPKGNSGGAVVDKDGNLIGIISRTDIDQGVTYVSRITALADVNETFNYQQTQNFKSNNYDYSYCTTKDTLQTWSNLTKSGEINMNGLHAIFLGLCEKVKRKEMTTEEADHFFFKMRESIFGF